MWARPRWRFWLARTTVATGHQRPLGSCFSFPATSRLRLAARWQSTAPWTARAWTGCAAPGTRGTRRAMTRWCRTWRTQRRGRECGTCPTPRTGGRQSRIGWSIWRHSRPSRHSISKRIQGTAWKICNCWRQRSCWPCKEKRSVYIEIGAWILYELTGTYHGQWWSILSMHFPHTLQWWLRSGLIASHLSQ